MHTIQSAAALKQPTRELALANETKMTFRAWTYDQAKQSAADAFSQVFQQSGCSKRCIKAQPDAYHRQCGIDDNTEIKAVATSEVTPEQLQNVLDEAATRNSMSLLEKMMNATDHNIVWSS